MRVASLAAIAILALPALVFGQTAKVIPAPPDVARPPADAAISKNKVASKVLTPGTGTTHPAADDLVTVQYTGWTADGKMFDTSTDGKPVTFPLNHTIPGWSEGVQLMTAGETRRLWIPESMAYNGQPNRSRGTLVIDVELMSFMPSPEKPPADVAAPPADAKKTASGIAYKVLTPGDGGRHPSPSSIVTVNYSGWQQANGVLFDSSYLHGEPAQFPLNGVIKGWTEGVALMVEGEKTRFWIPDDLAYKGQPSRPQGMLVFDVELLKIQ
ncbi:MAG TPA: FKBP-type peptidyl-prolyl cis-trans isomerase [Vicinamibacterales bacterium]|jgi:peptidylprolyl isomerase|nr:FKBP-type peptidyl-prolyl cis-trans isomerase [Vicinamibacterales bacterium]